MADGSEDGVVEVMEEWVTDRERMKAEGGVRGLERLWCGRFLLRSERDG